MQQNRIQRLSEQINASQHALAEIEAAYKEQQQAYQQEKQYLVDQRATLKKRLDSIDLSKIEQRIVLQARVVGTTLSNTYMNKTIAGRRFDAVLLDEVSMASLPLVYIAASHADSSVTLIGDPQQLAPIVSADTPLAKKWLGRDLFELMGISLKDAAEYGSHHSVLLDVQSRMHPQISVIANEHVYNRMLQDDFREKLKPIEPLPAFPLILCDTQDASPVASAKGDSRRNFYHALCSIALARKALNSVPEIEKKSEPCIGIVTPYAPQAQLLQKLINEDANLKGQIRAGTVHRFQGLEFDVVIFDTVQSPGLGPGRFLSGSKNSASMRLINVAVTRPRQKLIIVANRNYIRRNMPGSTLYLAVEDAAKAAIVPSLNIVGMPFASFIKKVGEQKSLVDNVTLHLNSADIREDVLVIPPAKNEKLSEIESFTEKTFYKLFEQDIQRAQTSIVIASPFITEERVKSMLDLLVKQQRRGVSVKVYTKPTEESKQWSIRAAKLVKDAGIELLYRSKMHEKLIFIDEKVVYDGSLNSLSYRDTRESGLRITTPRIVQEKLRDLLYSSEDHEKKVFIDDAMFEKLKTIEISVEALPVITALCDCDLPLIAKNGPYGAFYGCPNYSTYKHKCKEKISLEHLRQVKQFQNCICPRCGSSTSLRLRDNPQRVLLVCDAKCGEMQKITFTK